MTPPGEYVERLHRQTPAGDRVPARRRRRAAHPRPVREPRATTGPGGERGRPSTPRAGSPPAISFLDPAGHFRIVGRKKEIYKNRPARPSRPSGWRTCSATSTSVAQAFLVGDHREYNTLAHLAQPRDGAWPAGPLGGRAQRAASPRSSPPPTASSPPSSGWWPSRCYRAPLDLAHGELTRKAHLQARGGGEELARAHRRRCTSRSHLTLPVDGRFLRIPNWVLREMGVLQHEVSLRRGTCSGRAPRTLRVESDPAAPGSLRVGDLAYASDGSVVDLGALLARPALWVGNDRLRSFIGRGGLPVAGRPQAQGGRGRPAHRPAPVVPARPGADRRPARGGRIRAR